VPGDRTGAALDAANKQKTATAGAVAHTVPHHVW
jgi:hypothetical protein